MGLSKSQIREKRKVQNHFGFACNQTSLMQTNRSRTLRTSSRRSGRIILLSGTSKSSLSGVAPLEVVLFDIDGTLCDSDQIHYYAFREMLPEIGFNGGVPITEEYYIENFAGKHNDDVARILFPDDLERGLKFTEDKEAMFRRLAVDKLKPVNGLYKVKKWIEDRGLKRTKSMTSLELILMFQHPIWAPMLRPCLNIYF